MSGFSRANHLLKGMTGSQRMALAATALGQIGEHTLPQHIPWYVIDAMAYDPYIFLGEQIWAAPLQDAALYRVEHADPAIKAEAKAVLDKVKRPLLRAVCNAFAYGCSPYVMAWIAEDLVVQVARDGSKPFNRNMRGHQHYQRVHELHPGDVEVTLEDDVLVAIHYGRKAYGPDRGFLSTWCKRFGKPEGIGSRHRAYRPWYKGEYLDLWQGRYLERSVDPPRIGYAPAGEITIDGETFQATELLADAVMALKNGGVAALPGTVNEGERVFGVSVMDLPDRSDVFHKALNQTAADKFVASLVPPTAAGIADSAFASGRIHSELLQEVLNYASSWIAEQLEAVLEVPHRVTHGESVPAPKVVAREFPAAKAKRMLEIYKSAANVPRRVGEDQEVTLAELVDPSILEELGVPVRSIEDAAREKKAPPPMQPGRPRDVTSDREERRERAREPEGEDDTGQRGGRENPREADMTKKEWLEALSALNRPHPPQPAPSVTLTLPESIKLSADMPAPQVSVNVPEQPAPNVSVNVTPEVTAKLEAPEQPAPVVNVHVPEQPAPVVNVDPPIVNVAAPSVNVDVKPELKVPPRRVKAKRNQLGDLEGFDIE